MARERFLRPNLHLVAIDETSDWELPEYMDKILRIETVFMYDENNHHHLCEITPSYELYPVETRAILKPEFADDDRLSDAISQEIMSEMTYDVSYMHVWEVKSIIERYQKEEGSTPENKYDYRYFHAGDPFPYMKIREYRANWDWKEKPHEFYEAMAQAFRENAEL